MGTKRSEIVQETQFVWFGALFFSQNWTNFKKLLFFRQFWVFFEVYSILTKKQRTEPKKLTSLKNFASFGTHVAPKLAIHCSFDQKNSLYKFLLGFWACFWYYELLLTMPRWKFFPFWRRPFCMKNFDCLFSSFRAYCRQT